MAVPKWGGWWVKATVNSAPSAWGRPPQGVCSTSSSHISDCVVEADPGQSVAASPNANEKKKIPRADPRVMTRGRSRSNRSSQTNKRPTGSLLDRVRAETPTSKLETSTVVVKPYPQPRRGQLPMESHPAMIRNPSSFSKKILLDRTEFSK